jgi:hypothetical protein
MFRSAVVLAGAWLWAFAPNALLAQNVPSLAQPQAPLVTSITVTGAKEIPVAAIEDAIHVRTGEPLPDTLEHITQTIERHYRKEGYSFARVKPDYDAASGALAIDIDEGRIDGVEFQGIDKRLVRRFTGEFALRAGDVFNRDRARQALEVLLQQTRGAVRPGRAYSSSFTDTDEPPHRRGAFDLVDRGGQRVLVVGLREPPGRFKIVPDLGEREDWFSPVDGFVPSLGMGIVAFDHEGFNHTLVAGHLSYKWASQRTGYALGFERPLFGRTKVFVGGELHDLTASDDQWQVSSLEASLAAAGTRRSFRDYYRRRGAQINGAVRVHQHVEALVAWRGERQEPLTVASDFSLWRGDEPFRPNVAARDGRLNAVIVGASLDGRGFDRESLESSYRRHQLETPFGARLDDFEGRHDAEPIWRIDWTSEISAPDIFGSDFDFRRHIVTGRARALISEHQNVGVRAIGGWSDGVLPPQRLFAIGGIGSVHGYEFKEAVGDALALLNVEYELGWRGGPKVIGFFDAGRVTSTASADSPWLKGVGWGIGVGDVRIDFGYRVDAVPSSLHVLLRIGRTF